GRRFGVFFGVNEFRYSPKRVAFYRWMVAHGAKIPAEVVERGLNLPACQNDGVITADRMKSQRRRDDAAVVIARSATRRQMERSTTGWLPAVSKPGDTVFIYISSHGGQVEDDDGDEARSNPDDHLDEFLLPHDYIAPDMLDELRRDQRAGKPVDPWARR